MGEFQHASQISFVCGAFAANNAKIFAPQAILLPLNRAFIPGGAGHGMNDSFRKKRLFFAKSSR
jgi:hypothetical protein